MQPTLEEWTYEFIFNLINTPIVESDTIDFKFVIPEADVLTELCCSFANSDGGYIVFGITQESSFVIEGVDYDTEFARNFGDKLRANPPIDCPPPKFIKIPNSSKYLIVIHIPKSKSGPHVHRDLQKMKFWKRTSKGKRLMTLEEIRQEFERPLRARVEVLTDMLSTSYLEEKKRKQGHKVYYIRRTLAYYGRLLKHYSDYNDALTACQGDEDNSNKLRRLQISAKILMDSLDTFWYTAEGDFKDIQDMVDNPRLRDKFVYIVGMAVNFVKSSLTKHVTDFVSTHGLYYDRESNDTWMDAIKEFINMLKEEVRDTPL